MEPEYGTSHSGLDLGKMWLLGCRANAVLILGRCFIGAWTDVVLDPGMMWQQVVGEIVKGRRLSVLKGCGLVLLGCGDVDQS